MMLLRYMPASTTSAQIVAGILGVHFPDAGTVLDATPGRGCFWSETVPTHVAVHLSRDDFRCLPHSDAAYDVVAIDPPHLADGGRGSVMAARYGTYPQKDLETVVRGGVREAWRVARIGVIAKVTDGVHISLFQRMSGWIIDELGEPFDVVHQLHTPLIDPKWREPALSARNNGSSYLIFRHGDQRHRRRLPQCALPLQEAVLK